MDWTKCPEKYRGGLQRYFEHRIVTGSFLRAVLENDLLEAFGRWDGEDLDEFRGLLSWLYNEAPSRHAEGTGWGSPEKVRKWVAKGPQP